MKKINRTLLLLAIVIFIFTLAACNSNSNKNDQNTDSTEKTTVNVAALKGPTGLGMVKLMEDSENNKAINKYNFTLVGAPDEIVGKITTGEIDIAAVPTNLAAVLYNKTGGKVKIAALNTLGVIYILENGETINEISDLEGKTIYASGKGSTPEYILNYLLEKNGLIPGENVTIEYKSEHAELSTLMIANKADIVLLPEPFVTTTINKKSEIKIALNLTEEWDKIAAENKSVLSMGAIIVRDEFLKENKAAFDAFLNEYKASTEYTNNEIDKASQLAEKYEIIASADIAKKAIPNCNIVYIDGAKMKEQIKPFYEVLFTADPKSVGGKLPDDVFYYEK